MKFFIVFFLATTAIAGGLLSIGPGPGSKMGGMVVSAPAGTPTPCPTQGTSDGAAQFEDVTGYMTGRAVTFGATGTVYAMQAKVIKTGSNPASIKGALYNSVAGLPVTLVGEAPVQATVNGWNRMVFTTPVAVAAARYWMAYQVTTGSGSTIIYTSPSNGPNCVVVNTFGTAPNPYGACGGGFDWNAVVEICP